MVLRHSRIEALLMILSASERYKPVLQHGAKLRRQDSYNNEMVLLGVLDYFFSKSS